ncbi:MAG: Gfo/Idh/MocA family oxidoreductase [Flavobacteriaceae bacterium]|nr:Gfo/Idh/MocA family oxidoreductase [Flavobacteriaceae bacterium]
MQETTIRWGVIGCGKVTEVKSVPAYKNIDGFEIPVVMRRNLSLAKDFARRHNIEDYTNDSDELINHPNVDAIYIATPPDSHHYYAMKVAKAGKICCIEKPMARSYQECKEIVNAFKSKELPLFVAYYRRSLPRFEKLKVLIDSEEIGTIRHVNWSFHKPSNTIDLSGQYNWRTDIKVAYGGYFDDLASHGIDLFTHFFGTIKEASGICTNQQGLYTAMDTVSGSWLHTSGISGSGYWNFGASERKDDVELIGNKGKITFSIFDEQPIRISDNNQHREIVINHPKHIQYYHVLNMKSALFNKKEHPSTGKTAAHTSWVMDKILGKIK